SAEYRQACRELDAMVARIAAQLQPSDSLVVTADHGHIAFGGHGGNEPRVRSVPLILAGHGVAAGHSLARVSNLDVAPTVAALLGIAPPARALGGPLVELLAPDRGGPELAARDLAATAELRSGLERAQRKITQDAEGTRRRRLAGVIALLAVALALWLALGGGRLEAAAALGHLGCYALLHAVVIGVPTLSM